MHPRIGWRAHHLSRGGEEIDAERCRALSRRSYPRGENLLSAERRIAPHALCGRDRRAPKDFSAARVEAAVRAIQRKEIGYHEFCERIAAAGCVGYVVSLVGRRAVYYGRGFDTYVEPFPAMN
jgi:hypothetical protein